MVARLNRMRIVGHEFGELIGHAGDLVLHLRGIDLKRSDRDRDGIVRAELVVGARRNRQAERKALAAFQGALRRSLRGIRRNDVLLIDSERHEHLGRLRLDDRREILDAELVLDDLLDGLSLHGPEVHLLREPVFGGVQSLLDFFRRRNGFELNPAVV